MLILIDSNITKSFVKLWSVAVPMSMGVGEGLIMGPLTFLLQTGAFIKRPVKHEETTKTQNAFLGVLTRWCLDLSSSMVCPQGKNDHGKPPNYFKAKPKHHYCISQELKLY